MGFNFSINCYQLKGESKEEYLKNTTKKCKKSPSMFISPIAVNILLIETKNLLTFKLNNYS